MPFSFLLTLNSFSFLFSSNNIYKSHILFEKYETFIQIELKNSPLRDIVIATDHLKISWRANKENINIFCEDDNCNYFILNY